MRFVHKSLYVGAIFGTAALTLVGCSEPSSDNTATTSATEGVTTDGKTVLTLYTSEPEEKVDEINRAFQEENQDVEVQVYRAGTGDLKGSVAHLISLRFARLSSASA